MLTDEQLVARRGYIGGSDISAILGLDPFKSSFTVWLQKHEGYEAPRSEQLEAEADRGHHLEAGVLDWYGEREQRPVRGNTETFRSETRPIFGCTPDGFSLTPNTQGGFVNAWSLVSPAVLTRLVSVKCPRRGDDWGEQFTDAFPLRHQLQLQWEHFVLESKGYNLDTTLDLAALIYGELKVYRVERSHEVQAKLAGFAGRWWQRHMVEGIPPSVDGHDETAKYLKARYKQTGEKSREATLEESGLLIELKESEESLGLAKARHETAKQRVMAVIGEGAGVFSRGLGEVTWKANVNGVRTFRTNWRKR